MVNESGDCCEMTFIRLYFHRTVAAATVSQMTQLTTTCGNSSIQLFFGFVLRQTKASGIYTKYVWGEISG